MCVKCTMMGGVSLGLLWCLFRLMPLVADIATISTVLQMCFKGHLQFIIFRGSSKILHDYLKHYYSLFFLIIYMVAAPVFFSLSECFVLVFFLSLYYYICLYPADGHHANVIHGDVTTSQK